MNEKDILKVVQKVAGRPMRIKITLGVPNPTEIAKTHGSTRRCLRTRARAS